SARGSTSWMPVAGTTSTVAANGPTLPQFSEDAHHQVVAGYAHALKPNARLLDVGCGEGTLNAALRRFGYRRYLGIDISPVAIAKAQRLADADTAFMASPG